jgi:Flp pilus assembly protein CpaB
MTQSPPSSYSPAPETTPDWGSSPRRRTPFYLLAALILAILAGLATYAYLDEVRQQSVPTSRAVVALEASRPGDVLSAEMVEERDVPTGVLPKGALSSVSQAVGRAAIVPLAEGEVILEGKLSGDDRSALSVRLPAGRWAMVLPGSWLLSPIPEIGAGDHIDLMGYKSGAQQAEAGLIVSAVEVMEVNGEGVNPERLTIAVTLDEAAAIVYARVNGVSLIALLRAVGG